MKIFYTSALRDLMRPNRLVLWIVITIFTAIVAAAWKYMSRDSAMTNLEAYGQLADILIFRMAALTAAIFSMSVILQEIEQKTVILLLTRSAERWKMSLGRTLAAMTAAASASVLACLAGALVLVGIKDTFSAVIVKDLAILGLGAAAYTGIFVLISMVMKKALIVSLIYAFGFEPFVQNTSQGLNYLSVQSYMNAAADHAKSGASGFLSALSGNLGFDPIKPWLGWTVLAGIAALTIFIGMRVFTAMEFYPRDDEA
jgi:ABC-type transport system involved in multi-copper enzyme maturation permease subunit